MTPDTLTDALEGGQVAALLRASLLSKVQEHESRILAALIQHHRDGTLTDAVMRGGIAEIAALRSLLTALERDMRKGEQAARQLY